MRQAAIFDSGLMIILGEKESQIGISEDLVSIPTETLRLMFKGMQDVHHSGVMTFKRFTSTEYKLEVGRDESGYCVVSPRGFYRRIDKSEAGDLRDLIFGKYSSEPGFWWGPDAIAEEVL